MMKAYRLVDYYAGEDSEYYLDINKAKEEYVNVVSERIFEKDYEDCIKDDAPDAVVEMFIIRSKKDAEELFDNYINGTLECSDYDYFVEVIEIKE